MAPVDVAIVGGGMAGLTAALRCAEAGLICRLFEASDEVGGRVRSDIVDGFILDRGFQVFLTAYPEASHLLDYDALDLRPFVPGADVFANGRFHRVTDPRRDPIGGIRGAFSGLTQLRDLPALFRLATRWTPERIDFDAVPDITAEEALRQAGLSPRVIDAFFRPFFGGVFFDRDLHTSARMLAFCFGMFASGAACVPSRGMRRIPEHLAALLPPGTLELGTPVDAIEGKTLVAATGERVAARAVIVATESHHAAKLLGRDELDFGWRATKTLWFTADAPPSEEPILMLNGEGRGPVNHLSVLTNAAPMYSPDTRALIAANVVEQTAPDGERLVNDVRAQLTRWYGPVAEGWRHLHTHDIPHALPDQRVRDNTSVLADWQRAVALGDDPVYVCGDHRDNASINGAMASGRRAAETLISALGD